MTVRTGGHPQYFAPPQYFASQKNEKFKNSDT